MLRSKSKIPDYNADKESWHKHKWIVTKATQSPDFNAVEIGEKVMPFDNQFRFSVSDPGIADAIRQKHRWDVAVTRFKADDPADRGHKYMFTMPGVPWAKYDEYGRRIEEKGNGETQTDEGQAENAPEGYRHGSDAQRNASQEEN